MPWPVPAHLRMPAAAALLDRFDVELQLLSGETISAAMDAADDPAALRSLALTWHGQTVAIPVDEIRVLKRGPPLQRSTTTVAAADPASGEAVRGELLSVEVEFIDGQSLREMTCGFENRRSGGVYLYLCRGEDRCDAVWLPRHAVKSIRMHRLEAPIDPKAAPAGTPATTPSELHRMIARLRIEAPIPLADAMFELGLVDAVHWHALQSASGGDLRRRIDDLRQAPDWTEANLDHARARAVRIAEVDADAFETDPDALQRLPWSAAARLGVVPLGLIDGQLVVASSAPVNQDLAAQVRMLSGGPVLMVWSPRQLIERRLGRQLGSDPADPGAATAALPRTPEAELQSLLDSARSEIRAQGTFIHSCAVDEQSSIVQLVKRIILDAHAQKASDIHIETDPEEGRSRVRFRKDGELEDYLHLPPDLRAAMVSRIKVMSRLDIAERRRPQDGKINFADFSSVKLELRVAILPTHDGLEDVVLRLLATSRPIPLAKLGFSALDESHVKRLAQRPYGLLLACGPTGSGKTTTLHSLLAEINTDNTKIWTAEDPIEITQPGLRQVQINPKIGLSFASAMRAFLRADPDIIMIGEIRDAETAAIAVEASLTGHLVLSTLHTNNAAESVVRLLDLGMDPMNFGDSLICIVAQRLVRALCTQCRIPQPLSAEKWEAVVGDYIRESPSVSFDEGQRRLLDAGGWQRPDQARFHVKQGCAACGDKGYKGRIGVYEVLRNGPDLKRRIQARAPSSEIFTQAIEDGMRSLRQDALEKTCSGAIDLKQAASVFA